MGKTPVPALAASRGEMRQRWGKGIIPSLLHSSTHSTGPVLSPCPQGAHRLALCSGSPFAGRHPSPLLAEAETEARTKPIASLGSADERGLGDRAQDSGSRAPLKTLSRGMVGPGGRTGQEAHRQFNFPSQKPQELAQRWGWGPPGRDFPFGLASAEGVWLVIPS